MADTGSRVCFVFVPVRAGACIHGNLCANTCVSASPHVCPIHSEVYIQFLPFCESQTYDKLQILLPCCFFFFFFTAFPHEETVKEDDLHTCA